jgi:hypothetical protein
MASRTREPRLGVDIGRVIIDGASHPDGGDTAFFSGDTATMLATPEMTGVAEHLAVLVERFAGRVWLVSKCGPKVQERSLVWLDGHDLYARTGLDPGHVRFCRARADKRLHCEELALTHFVDDRADVHEAIRGSVEWHYFFGPQRGPVPSYARHASSWAELRPLIETDLSS